MNNSSTIQQFNNSTSNDVAIKVENVSKKYCKSLKRSMIYGIRDITKNVFGMTSNSYLLRKEEFWAVDDVSFEVKKGETLGIIGPNGAGKTTILKMLNGIFWPDKGKITIRGKVGALIAVGAGFHPMLSGRENIYINGAILGMSRREVDEKFDSIVEFADIGDFLDAPVKYYSSGMFVRLGFAVAIHCEPEILLIDEILAVGDLSFQNKCFRYLADLRKKAKGVVFVGHNLEQVRTICSKVMILSHGRPVYYGDTLTGIVKYHEMTRTLRLESMKKEKAKGIESRISSEEIEYIDSGILNDKGEKIGSINMNESLNQFCDFKLEKNVEELYFSMGILDERKRPCIWSISNDDNRVKFRSLNKSKYRIIVQYKKHHLMPGVYIPSVAIRNSATGETYERILPDRSFKVNGNLLERGIVHAKGEWKIKNL